MNAEEVIQLLDKTVDWYRTLDLQQIAANEPSDISILYENRRTASEVLGFAFDLARADAAILAQQPAATQGSDDATLSAPTLLQVKKKLDAEQASVQAEMQSQHDRLAQATAPARKEMQSKIAELQGELDLISARISVVNTMGALASGGGLDAAGALRAQIDAMAISLPGAGASATTPSTASSSSSSGRPAAAVAAANAASITPAPTSSSAPPPASSYGLWDLGANVFRLTSKIDTVDTIDRRTADLQTVLTAVRGRIVDQMRTLSAQGDALATRADSADSAALDGVRTELDSLAGQFKQASSTFIPLSKELVLLKQYRRNLKNWRGVVVNQSHEAIKTFGLRLGILLGILAVVFVLAEIWHRAVLRYVREHRRRYQLLLLRKIALWVLVAIIVGFAFASELGSLVTFAGLITAGLAVAMQSVLVSIVGYFFLIGKYGIRVGDRVQIGDVSGEVIEVGLVRMYLMEFDANGMQDPTGRVVAVANAVVFQVATGLFRHIPGVNFSWHEMTLGLPEGTDYTAAKEKLNAAVSGALAEFREDLDRQAQEIERATASSSGGDTSPKVQLKYSSKGVEAHVRYPVPKLHAAETDERVSRALQQTLSDLSRSPA